MLNELQKDLLTELVNVYVGQAANMLSEIVDKHIVLSIPEVELISITEVDPEDRRYNILFTEGHLFRSSLQFGYQFQGKAFLMFPAEQAKVLANMCLGELTEHVDPNDFRLMDTDLDVLQEVSNVLLNAIIGEFGNFLEMKLEYVLPEIELIHVTRSDPQVLLQNEVYILVLHTSFLLADTDVKGIIVIALSMDSISSLLDKIDALLGG
ncbi:chemotaxis protein CheC [Paenibacillus sp. JGP012]|jgi:chemotaxis protein CheC|uniref:Chemotaxis protein CheC n=1 Tax=Paenibacillus silvae TaxID=1325358 RepID=A0A2W6NMP6_9BACL|nr:MULTISPECIES: chemotaxis protein CheC [Paenibacillus]MBB6020088.1 chemotaxis protein CheC [Paenibacillus sp. JGP012]MBU5351618.1 chemotaxis protein CheC [Paenibacillus barcinonensis]MCK6073419.1 chemotaxis protein CheC [Paenibacillus silvae]MCK6149105.1 chemotaxis protein CheC [Paenibacillus silvae]MCK6267404.1 chemotaxis protein CheC [Paenibacillus silvae]